MTPDDLKDIPDGALVRLTVEGQVRDSVEEGYVRLVDPQSTTYVHRSLIAAIEVVPEPVVEPTGRLAMVTDNEGAPWVRSGESLNTGIALWRSVSSGSKAITWAVLKRELGPLTVVFEGVDA